MNKELKIVVVGAGAIGGITAALISDAGYDVELVTKHQSIADTANSEGIRISGIIDKTIKVKSVDSSFKLTGKKDICIIATKAYDLQDATKALLPFSHSKTLFVSMQNGICTDALAEIVGKEQTVGCVVGFGATMNKHADLVKTSDGDFIIGLLKGIKNNLIFDLQKILSVVAPTIISEDIFSELYSKLIINSCITSLGAICGLNLGNMLKIKKIRNIFLAVIKESMDVANAMKITVPPYAGKVDYYKMSSQKGGIAKFIRHLTLKIVGRKYKDLKSSSLQSLERGRKTEIKYFNGYISQKGTETNTATPINDLIEIQIMEIEAKQRKITLVNFDEFLV